MLPTPTFRLSLIKLPSAKSPIIDMATEFGRRVYSAFFITTTLNPTL